MGGVWGPSLSDPYNAWLLTTGSAALDPTDCVITALQCIFLMKFILRGIDTFGMLCHFYKGDNFCDFLFKFLYNKSRLSGLSKLFLFREDAFPERSQNNFERVTCFERVSIPYKSNQVLCRMLLIHMDNGWFTLDKHYKIHVPLKYTGKIIVKCLLDFFKWLRFHWFVLRFYGPVNPIGSCQVGSVYLTTLLLDGLSPLSG